MKVTNTRVYFWAGPLNNWTIVKGGILIPSKYALDGTSDFRLPTSEHVFMYLKAIFFKDMKKAKEIIEASSPKKAKQLGREIYDFSEELWEGYREQAMWEAISLRYESDPNFQKLLLSKRFKGKDFVETNPCDNIWSCGYIETDPRCELSENTWPGLNLFGKLLTKLRNEKACLD